MSTIVGTEEISPGSRAWYRSLWVHVLTGIVLGIAVGYWAPQSAIKMKVLGDVFIKAIRMMIAPIIFCTVAHGIARMSDTARVGRVAIKALVYFEILTTIALVLGLVMVNLLKPGVGMNVDLSQVDVTTVKGYIAETQHQDFATFLINIIPAAFLGAFAEGNTLQVLFIAVLCGIALANFGSRGQPIVKLLESASEMLFGVMNLIMWSAPLGAFGAIAFTVGRFGVASLDYLGWLVGGFWATCLIFVAGVLWPICAACGLSLPKLLRYLKDELLIVLATTSTETVLPQLIRKLERAGCEESVVGLVVPTGYSFNLDGSCLYFTMVAVFLAQATNTPLDLTHQIGLLLVLLLTSKGVAGVANASFITLVATLATTDTIPIASVALILGIQRLFGEGVSPTNLIGNAVATIVVAKWEGALDEKKMKAALEGRESMGS
jgi:aerobic C4-dicarboxylate transport protein